jgi:hypothetical protein
MIAIYSHLAARQIASVCWLCCHVAMPFYLGFGLLAVGHVAIQFELMLLVMLPFNLNRLLTSGF